MCLKHDVFLSTWTASSESFADTLLIHNNIKNVFYCTVSCQTLHLLMGLPKPESIVFEIGFYGSAFHYVSLLVYYSFANNSVTSEPMKIF